jgi:hypothetical protein
MYLSCLGNEDLEVEGGEARQMQTLHLLALLVEMGEASLDWAVALEQAVEKQLVDEVS